MEFITLKSGNLRFKEKIYLADGTVETKTFVRKTDAKEWKRQKQIERDRERALGVHALKENIPFDMIFDCWLDIKIKPSRSPKTLADYKCLGRKHLKKHFGNTKIRSIGQLHGDRLIQKLKQKGLANKTANKVLMVFKQVLKFAEVQGYIRNSPLRHFPMLPENKGRVDFLTHQEVIQLLRANANEEIYPLLVLALNTGMRVGEITGLCWDRINLTSGYIEVSRSMTRKGLKESTKTNLVRYVPINEEVNKVFQELFKVQKSPTFVFVNPKGLPYNPDHFSKRHFEKALEKANVRKVNFHVLRHTYASHYVMNGGSIYDLQKILGHTKVDMTMIYAHLSPEHLKGKANTVRFSADGDRSHSPYLDLREKRIEQNVSLEVCKRLGY